MIKTVRAVLSEVKDLEQERKNRIEYQNIICTVLESGLLDEALFCIIEEAKRGKDTKELIEQLKDDKYSIPLLFPERAAMGDMSFSAMLED